MALDFLLDRFDDLPATRSLAEGLPAAGSRLGVGGLPGSSPAVLIAALARRLPQRVFTVVAPTPADAERWLADLQMLGCDTAALYPQRESLGTEEPHYEIAGERIETLEALLRGAARILVTTARATAERTGVPRALERARLVLPGAGSLSQVVEALLAMGYVRVPTVTEVAQFSVRGGILDAYGFGMAAPARIEWWGDEIASLRSFDLDTQRSGEGIERVTVLPVRTESERGMPDAERVRSSLLELLPSETLLIVEQESAVEREVERAWAEAAHHLEVARRLGEDPPRRDEVFVDPEAWRAALAQFGRVAVGAAEGEQRFPLAPPEAVERDLKRLRRIVASPSPPATVILCDNEGQLERLEELLGADAGSPLLVVGALDGGFILPALRVLTDHEIFRRARRLRRPRRYRSAVSTAVARPLAPGDYVVHLEHGIGIYRGLQTIAVGGRGGGGSRGRHARGGGGGV